MKTPTRIALSLGVAGLLLALLMTLGGVHPTEVAAALRNLSPAVFFGVLAIHLGVYLLRALRFRLLLPEGSRPGFGAVLAVSAAHNMASYLLPAKTGEASWVFYLKAQCGVRASAGLASLLVARLLDAAVLSSAVALSCLWISLSHKYDGVQFGGWDSRVFLGLTGAVLVVMVLVCAALAARPDWLVRLVTFFLRFVRLHHWTVGERMVGKLYQAAVALKEARNGRRFGLAALTSLPVWCGVFAFYVVLAHTLGLAEGMTLAEVVFGSSLGVAANLLPANAFAGVGTQEGGWLLGFGVLGADRQLTLATSIGVHAVQLFNVVAVGLIAHLFMGVMPRSSFDGPAPVVEPELPPVE